MSTTERSSHDYEESFSGALRRDGFLAESLSLSQACICTHIRAHAPRQRVSDSDLFYE